MALSDETCMLDAMWFTLVKVCFSVKVKLVIDGLVTERLDEGSTLQG